MKKVLGIAAACLIIAGLSTSCNKNCTCTLYGYGVVVAESEQELDKDSYNKCSDLNTVVIVNGKKNGLECK